MVTASRFAQMALDLPKVEQKSHFDRQAFRVARIFATLAGDGLSANLKFTPDEQEFHCQLAPHVFRPIDNGWGRQGWTVLLLESASEDDVAMGLKVAYQHALPATKAKR